MNSLQTLQAMVLLEDNKQHKQRLKFKKQNEAYWESRGVIENALVSPNPFNKSVSIYDEPVSFEEFKSKDPTVTGTRGLYTIRYIPSSNKERIQNLPFQIGQDLLYWKVLCSGYTQWKGLAKAIPELGWLDRNSTLSPELFAIAKAHPGIAFYFTVDWVRYSQMIIKKAEEQGIDIDHKPFVAYACSQKAYEEKYKDKEIAKKKEYNDYVKEIQTVRARKETNQDGK